MEITTRQMLMKILDLYLKDKPDIIIDGLDYETLDRVFFSSSNLYKAIAKELMAAGDPINFKKFIAKEKNFNHWANLYLIEVRRQLVTNYLNKIKST